MAVEAWMTDRTEVETLRQASKPQPDAPEKPLQEFALPLHPPGKEAKGPAAQEETKSQPHVEETKPVEAAKKSEPEKEERKAAPVPRTLYRPAPDGSPALDGLFWALTPGRDKWLAYSTPVLLLGSVTALYLEGTLLSHCTFTEPAFFCAPFKVFIWALVAAAVVGLAGLAFLWEPGKSLASGLGAVANELTLLAAVHRLSAFEPGGRLGAWAEGAEVRTPFWQPDSEASRGELLEALDKADLALARARLAADFAHGLVSPRAEGRELPGELGVLLCGRPRAAAVAGSQVAFSEAEPLHVTPSASTSKLNVAQTAQPLKSASALQSASTHVWW